MGLWRWIVWHLLDDQRWSMSRRANLIVYVALAALGVYLVLNVGNFYTPDGGTAHF